MKILLYAILCAEVIMSLISYVAYAADKRKAKRGAWRISEKTLLLLAFLFGAPGALAAMRRFRHKTQHRKFTLSVPFFLVMQIALIAYVAVKALA